MATTSPKWPAAYFRRALRNKTYKTPTRAVLLYLGSAMRLIDGRQRAWPSHAVMAADLGLSRRSVIRAVKELKDDPEPVISCVKRPAAGGKRRFRYEYVLVENPSAYARVVQRNQGAQPAVVAEQPVQRAATKPQLAGIEIWPDLASEAGRLKLQKAYRSIRADLGRLNNASPLVEGFSSRPPTRPFRFRGAWLKATGEDGILYETYSPAAIQALKDRSRVLARQVVRALNEHVNPVHQ